MKNRGSTPIFTNVVGVHARNIHTQFEANPCSSLRGRKTKKVHADDNDDDNDDNNDDDGHRVIARDSHSLNVTNDTN